jgi:hypothetical protein
VCDVRELNLFVFEYGSKKCLDLVVLEYGSEKQVADSFLTLSEPQVQHHSAAPIDQL